MYLAIENVLSNSTIFPDVNYYCYNYYAIMIDSFKNIIYFIIDIS